MNRPRSTLAAEILCKAHATGRLRITVRPTSAPNDGRHVPNERWKQSGDLGSVAKVGFEATTEASASPRHPGQN